MIELCQANCLSIKARDHKRITEQVYRTDLDCDRLTVPLIDGQIDTANASGSDMALKLITAGQDPLDGDRCCQFRIAFWAAL